MLRTLVSDYDWIHTGLGVLGNVAFFAGSILFLPALEPWKVWGVWLFIGGAFFMLIGALGNLAAKLYRREEGG